MKRKSLLLMMLLAFAAPWTAQAQQFSGGDGTSSNPYKISNTNDWHTLATYVNNGTSYSGKYFKLTQNISVTEMVGGNASDTDNEDKPFSGTFDGDGHTLTFTYTTSEETCAPFRSAKGATFKNLRVDGSITTSAQYAGGIVGIGRGSTDGITFTNCVSNITITSTYNGDSTHGGFAAILFDGEQHFTGCVFTGSFNGTSSTSWAGFVGYSHTWGSCYGSAYDKCVFAPTSIQASVPSSCAAFDRNSNGCDFTNCYYTTDYGTNDGTKVYSVTGESPVNVAMRGSATNTYELNNSNCSLKFYSAGLTLTKNGTTTVYGANGNTLNLTLSGASAYSANHGTLAGSGSDYTLMMPSSNVVISEDQGGGSGGDCAEIATGATASSSGTYGGIYTYYNRYAYTQQIYTAAELTAAGASAGLVESIALKYAESTASALTFDVYLGQTTQTTVPTTWITNANLTLAYSGTTTFSGEGEWNNIDVSSAGFEWDGTSNVVVAIHRTNNTQGSVTYPDFYYIASTNMMAYYAPNSSSDITLNSSHVPSSNGTNQDQRPAMKFCIEVPTTCEDFESYSDQANTAISGGNTYGLPTGWSSSGNTGDYKPHLYKGNYSIDGVGIVMTSGPSYGGTDSYLISNVTLATGDEIHFNTYTEGSSADTRAMYYGYWKNNAFQSLGTAEFVKYNATGVDPTQGMTTFTVPAAANGCNLAWRWNVTSSYWSAVIDNVCVPDGGSTPTYITEIATVANWEAFCAAVNGGHDYSNETVKMTDNVGTVSTMCGTESNPFRGTFDGQGNTLNVNITGSSEGTAPFQNISGATIKDLVITGSVTCSAHFGSGLVGFAADNTTNTINNCLVSTTVSVSRLGGGIIGHGKRATVNIVGCVFNGQIINTAYDSSTNRGVGGLVGWCDPANSNNSSATLNITNTLFAGTYQRTYSGTEEMLFHPVAISSQPGSGVTCTLNNVYYTFDQVGEDGYYINIVTNEGKHAYSITGASPVTVEGYGTGTNYDVSGITSYGTGIEYDDVLYAGDGDQVSLTLNGSNTGYDANYGDLTGSNPYTLGMTANNTIITTPKLHIANTASETAMTWDQFAAKVNAGRTYSSLTVCLDEDITTSTMVGTSANRFKGIFDGQNKTITFNKTITDESTQYVAPFAYIENATVRNLKVAGTVNSNHKFAGGVVGRAYSSTVINCKNSTTINATRTESSVFNASHGGIVSHASGTITITGCVFDGKMIGTGTYYWCGILGYVSNNTTIAINDCFFAPTEVNVSSNAENYTIYRNELSGYNNYYNEEGAKMTTKRGTRVYSVTGESPVNVAMSGSPLEGHSYNVSGLNRYSTGITFDQVVYGSENETLSITLDGANSYEANNGTLEGSGSSYTLTMAASNTIISGVSCAVPTNLRCTYYNRTSVTLAWTAGGDEEAWQVKCWPTNLTEPGDLEGYTTNVSTNPYTLTNLTEDQTYYVKVRAKCDENNFSDWTSIIDVTPQVLTYLFTNADDTADDNWNELTNWQYYVGSELYTATTLPTINDNVQINAACTIPNECLAQANEITILTNQSTGIDYGSITIENGGQLQHNNEGVVVTVKRYIAPYGSNHVDTNLGYKIISFPASGIYQQDECIEGLLTANPYDFYTFEYNNHNNLEENVYLEWRHVSNDDVLDPYKGYLYASQNGTTISVKGVVAPSVNQEYHLDYVAGVAPFNGWQLVGNPFVCNAYLTAENGNLNFYEIKDYSDYAEFYPITSAVEIPPMGGVMVWLHDDDDNLVYSRTEPNSEDPGILNMDVNKASMRGTTMLDRARVRFGEGRNLKKLQLNPRHTKLYIPEGSNDYAVYYAEGAGTIPVNFKAQDNGRYTLSFSTEDVGFNYLHLIDNMNGNDVDLLQTPYYAFDAKSTDFASRFTLVFATGNDNDGNFAFFNNGVWIINNPSTGAGAEATLQVVDVLGHILSSETISGSCSKAINVAPGVYMLRLVNGDKVKVQKIVVR